MKRTRATLLRALLLGASCSALACAHAAKPPVGYTLSTDVPTEKAPPSARHHHAAVPEDIVMRSETSISGVRTADNQRLNQNQLLDELAQKDVICFGESHDDPQQHYAEYAVLSGLLRRAQTAGRELGLGMEMFQIPFQQQLDGFLKGTADEARLLESTEYRDRWGFPFAFYRPLLDVARGSGLRVLALNADRDLTHRVASEGLASLTNAERRALPNLDLENAEHRHWFDDAMRGHPAGHGEPANLYAAQVIWDETMADTAASWHARHPDVRQLLVVAGRMHCHASAIPARIRRRTNVKVVSIGTATGKEAAAFDYHLELSKS